MCWDPVQSIVGYVFVLMLLCRRDFLCDYSKSIKSVEFSFNSLSILWAGFFACQETLVEGITSFSGQFVCWEHSKSFCYVFAGCRLLADTESHLVVGILEIPL